MKILLSTSFKRTLFALHLIFSIALSANAQSFECNSDLYQVVNGNELKRLIPSTGVYETIGTSSITYNGAGFNIEDNFIYGIGSGTVLVRIDNSGEATNLGTISGFSAISYSGDFDVNGNWYSFKKAGSSWLMNKIDVSNLPPVATEYPATEISGVTSASNANDLAFNAVTQKFYGMNGGILMEFDPVNRTVSAIADYSALTESGGYGAVWSDESGNTYFFNNNTGNIYRASFKASGEITSFSFISRSSPNGNNDGMSCPTAQAPVFPEICDNGIDDDNDGLTDCEDPDCTSSATCGVSGLLYNSAFACQGSIATFHAFFTNNSSLSNTITVTEKLPEGFVFLQDTLEFDGAGHSTFYTQPKSGDQDEIQWGEITLNGGETVRISYDVMLNSEATNGSNTNAISVELSRTGTIFSPAILSSSIVVGECPTPRAYSCEPGFYQVYKKKGKNQPNVYGQLNPVTGDYDQIAVASDYANGLGFDINSGLVYGASGNRFIQLDSDGLVIDQGITFDKTVYRGDINEQSEWYGVVGNDMIKIDVGGTPFISDTYSGEGLPGWDIAYNKDGHFYSIHDQYLYQFNTSSNTKSIVGTLNGPNLPDNGGYGAQWTGSDGYLYASHNQSGQILRVDVKDASARVVSLSIDGLSKNDGFSCPTSIPVVFEFDYGDNSRLPQSRILSYRQDFNNDKLPDFTTFWLGNTVDYENTDPSNPEADGDIDDGLVLSTQIDNGTLSAIIGLNTNIGGQVYYLLGIDWNDDGSFDDVLTYNTDLNTANTVIESINTPLGYTGGFINVRVIISGSSLASSQITGDILELGEVEDYRYQIYEQCSGSDCSVSTGTSGGLESNGDLAGAIAKRNYNRVKNNYKNHLRDHQEKLIELKASGLTRGNYLNKYFPEIGATGKEEVTVSSPDDLIGITNAKDVFGVDYYLDNQRVAASLLLETEDYVYNHSKNVCDRLNGKAVEDVQMIRINGIGIILAKITSETKGIEYSAWFSAKEYSDKYEVYSQWNVDSYPTGNYLNFQVWSSSPNQIFYLLQHILAELRANKPLEATAKGEQLPDVIVKSGHYENGALILTVMNKNKATSAMFDINLRRTEQSAFVNEKYNMELTGNTYEDVTIRTGFLFDAGISLRVEGSEAYDVLYLADGAWGIDYDPSLGEISEFKTIAASETGENGDYHVERGFEIDGTSSDVVNVFRNLKAGIKSVVLNTYSTLSFDIQNDSPVEIILVEKGLIDWDKRLRLQIPAHSEMARITIRLDDFYGNDQSLTLDLQALVFSYVNKSGTQERFRFSIGTVIFGNEMILSTDTFISNASDFKIYPNPATDVLNIRVKAESGILTIANINGQAVMVKAVDARDFQNGIPLSLTSGLYIVTFKDSIQRYSRLLQVE